ncbi:MAG: hypothetical protein ACR2QH_05620 [Geminicoccaceae bacterium]|jgi:mannose-1-phosphate guanylyltransferase
MNTTITLSKDNELLQETATRLIKALGVDMAIFICRSNYWHGVLQLILDQESSMTAAAEVEPASEPIRLHSLPKNTVEPVRRYADVQEIAIAA